MDFKYILEKYTDYIKIFKDLLEAYQLKERSNEHLNCEWILVQKYIRKKK